MRPSRIAFAVVVLALSVQLAAAQENKPPLVTRGRVELNLAGAEAVGVGGGTGEQDLEVAKAGIAALLDALCKTP